MESFDPTNQLSAMLSLADQLREARTLSGPKLRPTRRLVVAGMGGSIIAARLAHDILADRLLGEMTIVNCYELPTWVDSETTVLCSSYSGGTDETLGLYGQARAAGAQCVVVASGGELLERAQEDGVASVLLPEGVQPRAAVGYNVVAVLLVLNRCGVAPDISYEITAAAELLDQLGREWGSLSPDSLPIMTCTKLTGRTPIFVGAGVTDSVATRIKGQVAENAKRVAFATVLPESNHNELAGWACDTAIGSFATVFLTAAGQHPAITRRIGLTAMMLEENRSTPLVIDAWGDSRAEQVLSLVHFGDLLSYAMAIEAGVDPVDITPLNRLKAGLGSAVDAR